MQRISVYSAFLLALHFPSMVEGHSCTPPKKIDGGNARHQTQIKLAEDRELPFFETATAIKHIVEKGDNQLSHVPNEGVGFRVRSIGINPVPKDPPEGCAHYPEHSRPWLHYVQSETLAYIQLLGTDFENSFPNRFIEVTGLSRTKKGQELLQACYATVHSRSPHQWGITFDIAWRSLSHDERCWLLDRLSADQDKGYAIVVDEITWGKHLHVTVHPDWLKLREYKHRLPEIFLGFSIDFH